MLPRCYLVSPILRSKQAACQETWNIVKNWHGFQDFSPVSHIPDDVDQMVTDQPVLTDSLLHDIQTLSCYLETVFCISFFFLSILNSGVSKTRRNTSYCTCTVCTKSYYLVLVLYVYNMYRIAHNMFQVF